MDWPLEHEDRPNILGIFEFDATNRKVLEHAILDLLEHRLQLSDPNGTVSCLTREHVLELLVLSLQ